MGSLSSSKSSMLSIVSLSSQHKHLFENMKHSGFLPLLVAAAAPVIGGVAGGLIDKAISGSGICHKKHWKKLYEIGMVDVLGESGSLKNRSG